MFSRRPGLAACPCTCRGCRCRPRRAPLPIPQRFQSPPVHPGVRVSIAPRETPTPLSPTQAGCSAPRGSCSAPRPSVPGSRCSPRERFPYPLWVWGAGADVMLTEREGGARARATAAAVLGGGTANFRHPTQQLTLLYRVPIYRAPHAASQGKLKALK